MAFDFFRDGGFNFKVQPCSASSLLEARVFDWLDETLHPA